jgi:rare lipoprotein A
VKAWRGPALALAAALAAAGCSHTPSRPPAEERTSPRPRPAEVGVASYYGREFQGRRTASGERYDRRALTCAHPRYPFGTLLRVTELESGRSVVVRVTDRGPFAEGRIIDLSWAAARALGMLERGLARVAVELAR